MTLSRELMLGMIRRAGNGEQILQILDVIVSSLNEDSTSVENADVSEAELVLI